MAEVDANAWTTLEATKRHLGVDPDNTDQDDLITDLINAAYKALEGYIHHPLKAADYIEEYSGDGTNTLILRKYPINSVEYIYDDVLRDFAAISLIDSENYVIDNDEEVGSVRLFKNVAVFTRGVKNIKIKYNAGFTDENMPADAKTACHMLVSYLKNRGGTEAMTAQSLGGKSETYEVGPLPAYIRTMVDAYKEYCV